MSITITATKRAHGTLYAQVTLAEEASGCNLAVRAVNSNGRYVPAVVQRTAEESIWLVSLASLSVTQTLSFVATTPEGTLAEEASAKLGPLTARIAPPARLNRKRPRQTIVLPGGQTLLGEWDVCVERLVPTRSEYEVCQGHARLMGAGRKAVQGEVRVRALDTRGEDIAATEWICLCDVTTQLTGHPGFYVRHVEFSLRTPRTQPAMTLWVEPLENDAQGAPLPCGFAALDNRTTAELRTAWRDEGTSAYDDETYDVWYRESHAVTEGELVMQREVVPDGPLFSVVMVARKATPTALGESVASVLEQSYRNLELVLVDAAPEDRHLVQAVRGIEVSDPRMRVVPLAADFGIAAATSEGIDAAMGDFICLLGEGDLLAPDALWCLASEVASCPHADLIYTDEDRIEHGRYLNPLFKADWDPDLMLGGNYLGGLLCLRAKPLHELETMGPALDGAQGYHLALVVSRQAREIRHVPRVLYHARAEETNGQGAAEAASGLVALRGHLGELGVSATAKLSTRVPQSYEVHYDLPDNPPLVSVILLNRDNVASLDRCLTSLREHTAYDHYEVVIVENGSSKDETFAYYQQAEAADEHVRTIFYQDDAVFDEARLIAFGVSRARGDLLLLLHNDIEFVDDDWMGRLVSLCLRRGTGAASARLLRADGTIDSCGETMGPHGPVGLGRYLLAADEGSPLLALLHTTTFAPGACLMVRRKAFERAGGVPLPFVSRFGVEDLCLRLARMGLRVVIDPQVSVIHHRALAADAAGVPTSEEYRATGMLWQDWPFGMRADDPSFGPNVAPGSPYGALLA